MRTLLMNELDEQFLSNRSWMNQIFFK